MGNKPTLGIIGAGRLGTTVARLALKAGYTVQITNSKGPQSLHLILRVLLPGAQAATVEDTIHMSDIIILAIPLHQYESLNPEWFAHKIVIDAMNYWPETEGIIEEFSNSDTSSSKYIQQFLPKAKVVKTLNHIAYIELEEHVLPEGSPKRRAVLIAGDDRVAKQKVSQLISDIGFDPVDFGSLSEGKKFQPKTELFNKYLSSADVMSEL